MEKDRQPSNFGVVPFRLSDRPRGLKIDLKIMSVSLQKQHAFVDTFKRFWG